MHLPYAGELLALTAAALWAVAFVLFRKSGETVHPIALNVGKNLLALLLYAPTILLTGGRLNVSAPAADWAVLAVSGVIGIAAGDTLQFHSLNLIGASRAALVSCLYSPFIIGLSLIFLGDRLTLAQWGGAALIVVAVLETVRDARDTTAPRRRRLVLGVALGALAMLTNAIGVILFKPLLARLPLLWVLEVRLLAGICALLAYLAFDRRRVAILGSLVVGGVRWEVVVSSVLGGYLSMMAWMGAFKLTQVSVAAALNQINTIFILLLASAFLRERITPLRALAVLSAVAGAVLVTFAHP